MTHAMTVAKWVVASVTAVAVAFGVFASTAYAAIDFGDIKVTNTNKAKRN